jgi:hypothetical protein
MTFGLGLADRRTSLFTIDRAEHSGSGLAAQPFQQPPGMQPGAGGQRLGGHRAGPVHRPVDPEPVA